MGDKKIKEKMRNSNSLTVPKNGKILKESKKKLERKSLCFGMAFCLMLEALDALKMKHLVPMVQVH